MIIKAQCPKCAGRGAKSFEIKVDLPQGCAIRQCELAGQVEVIVDALKFWMCNVHASGYTISKKKEVMG